MTLKFLVDENFNHKTLAGIKRREPGLDIVAVQEVGLRETEDPEVLDWAAQEGRVVVTHDVSTFSVFAFERVAAGLPMPGVIEIPETVPMRVILVRCHGTHVGPDGCRRTCLHQHRWSPGRFRGSLSVRAG
jgi:hypothetical protein